MDVTLCLGKKYWELLHGSAVYSLCFILGKLLLETEIMIRDDGLLFRYELVLHQGLLDSYPYMIYLFENDIPRTIQW